MSWREIDKAGIDAVSGHHAIMTLENIVISTVIRIHRILSLRAIGGYPPLEKVYSYNPVPDSISADKQRFYIGSPRKSKFVELRIYSN